MRRAVTSLSWRHESNLVQRKLMRPRSLVLAFFLAFLAGCGSEPAPRSPEGAASPSDTGFSAIQERGRVAMGVDQYTSTHLFDALPDGGRIELQRDMDDLGGVATIRQHLQEITAAFQAGDFRIPGFVHAQDVPGTAVMAQKKDRIRYTYSELPRGGQVQITTTDAEALQAIHEFLAFQRHDHRAGGHEH
jgi:hypothetical protein